MNDVFKAKGYIKEREKITVSKTVLIAKEKKLSDENNWKTLKQNLKNFYPFSFIRNAQLQFSSSKYNKQRVKIAAFTVLIFSEQLLNFLTLIALRGVGK